MTPEAREEFERYVHKISHDLQSPVSKIITISELLMDRSKELSDADRDYLQRLFEAGRQLKTMIDGLTNNELSSFKSLRPDG